MIMENISIVAFDAWIDLSEALNQLVADTGWKLIWNNENEMYEVAVAIELVKRGTLYATFDPNKRSHKKVTELYISYFLNDLTVYAKVKKDWGVVESIVDNNILYLSCLRDKDFLGVHAIFNKKTEVATSKKKKAELESYKGGIR